MITDLAMSQVPCESGLDHFKDVLVLSCCVDPHLMCTSVSWGSCKETHTHRQNQSLITQVIQVKSTINSSIAWLWNGCCCFYSKSHLQQPAWTRPLLQSSPTTVKFPGQLCQGQSHRLSIQSIIHSGQRGGGQNSLHWQGELMNRICKE